jgi:hypothetical protein
LGIRLYVLVLAVVEVRAGMSYDSRAIVRVRRVRGTSPNSVSERLMAAKGRRPGARRTLVPLNQSAHNPKGTNMKSKDSNKRGSGLGMDTAANGSMLVTGILIVIFAIVGDLGEAVAPAVQADYEVTSWLG